METASSHSREHLWDKIWRDKHGHIVIFQMPNIPLYAWLVLTIISLFVHQGKVQNVIWWLSTVTLAIWALLELFKGVNYFRRGLGLVVFCMTIASAFGVGR